MRVCYDYQIVSWQKYGGISRYFFELSQRLKNLGVDVKIGCFYSTNYYFREQFKMRDAPKNKYARLLWSRTFGRAYRLMNRVKSLYYMSVLGGADIVHPTDYKTYMLGHYSGKLVVTVYDMIHEKYGLDQRTTDSKNIMLHAADCLIAISENTKKDILDIYPDINPDKISVIYLGNSLKETDPDKSKNPLGGRYVLFVGSRSVYKNFPRFIRAMRPVLDRHKDLYVLCAGGGAFTAEELEIIGSMSSRYVQRYFDDDGLAQAYANAECFVFPSEYEGFGIPLLEAFACKCPLLCADASSFPEVAGDAAEYFDPFSVDEMSAKIMRVIEDDSLREKIRLAGCDRLTHFSWDKTARETLECYRKVLGK